MSKKWKAALYLRLSKDDGQAQESGSIKNQREILRSFLKNYDDIDIISERIDDGVSGINFDRPGFNAMIADIHEGVIDCVVVKDLSRFGRNLLEGGRYIQQIFPNLGVRFIAANDGYDSEKDDLSKDITLPFRNLVNSIYSRDNSAKCCSSFQVKRQQGQFVGPFVSYGYEKSPQNKNEIVIDTQVADIVQEIFMLCASGTCADKIADHLNERGIPSPSEYRKLIGSNYSSNFTSNGKSKWHSTTIRRILENPLYIGTLVQGKTGRISFNDKKVYPKPEEEWIVVENNHQAIVTKQLFDTVQKARILDTRTPPKGKNIHPFSGLLTCGTCGKNLSRKTIPSKNGTKYVYFTCKHCKSMTIKEEDLEEAVFLALKTAIYQRTNLQEVLSQVNMNDLLQARMERLLQQKGFLYEEYHRNIGFQNFLAQDFENGNMEEEQYASLSLSYDENISKIKNHIHMNEREIEKLTKKPTLELDWLEYFAKHENASKISRLLLVELVDKVVLSAKNSIQVVLRFENDYDILVDSVASLKREVS